MAENYIPDTDSAFVVNKPIATIGVALDRRSQLPVEEDFLSRDFISTTEAIDYYNTDYSREGGFSIFINSTGALQPDGTILGGVRQEYWWRDGVGDEDLVQKVSGVDDVPLPTPSNETFIII